MKKLVIVVVVAAALTGVARYSGLWSTPAADQPQAGGPGGAGGAGGGRGGAQAGPRGGGRAGGGRAGAPLTVELATASRGLITSRLTVVGNLVGDATVAVVPRAAGRLEQVYVKLGDRVAMGQRIAKIEDQELREQIKQAEAAQQVSQATIRQREADLQLAQTNVERSRNLYQRQLLPKQTLDDNESRYQSALAAIDLSRAQSAQSQARLEELRVNMTNTVIISPVDGFVARRAADPGAFASQNAPVVDVVDIRRVRLVVNVVEKDLKQIQAGDQTVVEVDAYPGETFTGRIARVSPVLDPATRTAAIEIEIPNADFRLKPGMYARVGITTEERPNALIVPANAVVDVGSDRGVYMAGSDNTAEFRKIEIGIEDDTRIEILAGLTDGDRIVSTGAAGLRDGAPFLVAGARGRGGRGRNGGGGGRDQAGAAPAAPTAEAVGQRPGRGGRRGTDQGDGQSSGRDGRRGGGRRGGDRPPVTP